MKFQCPICGQFARAARDRKLNRTIRICGRCGSYFVFPEENNKYLIDWQVRVLGLDREWLEKHNSSEQTIIEEEKE